MKIDLNNYDVDWEKFAATKIDIAIASLLNVFPDLGLNGWNVEDDSVEMPNMGSVRSVDSLRAIWIVGRWIIEHMQVTEIAAGKSSYQLKHIAEKEVGYLTNGQFIVAALLLGYSQVVRGHHSHFNMIERSGT